MWQHWSWTPLTRGCSLPPPAYCARQRTMEFHWGKHHQAYVTNLNAQIKGTDLDSVASVEEVSAFSWGPPARLQHSSP